MSLSSENYKCIICLDSEDIYINCNQCVECRICFECYHLMMDIDQACPICRKKDDWEFQINDLINVINFIKLKNVIEDFFINFDFYFYHRKYIREYLLNNIFDI